MTESEWDTCADPEAMLASLQGQMSERKLRLFACFCYRRFHEYLANDHDGDGLFAIEMAEAYADGLVTSGDLVEVRQQIVAGLIDQCSAAEVRHEIADLATAVPLGDVAPATEAFVTWVEANVHWREGEGLIEGECAAMCAMLHDLIGNPFRTVVSDRALPSWKTDTVVKLAQAIYDAGAFDRLPILADALEEAGCPNTDILDHCRGTGPHVRGCWVIDALLGKE